jgi:hypothetical protein
MRFDFRGSDGTVRSRWITRDPAQIPTGRFLRPGRWPVARSGAATVDIHMAGAFGPSARVAACPEPTCRAEPRDARTPSSSAPCPGPAGVPVLLSLALLAQRQPNR